MKIWPRGCNAALATVLFHFAHYDRHQWFLAGTGGFSHQRIFCLISDLSPNYFCLQTHFLHLDFLILVPFFFSTPPGGSTSSLLVVVSVVKTSPKMASSLPTWLLSKRDQLNQLMIVRANSKVTLIWIIFVCGSFSHDYFPLPSCYFSKSSNILNQYFVKIGWAWTSLLVSVYIFRYVACRLHLFPCFEEDFWK